MPSIRISPPVTSCNLGIKFKIVDLPLPVPPIIAVVLPGVNLKLMFFKVSFSLPG